MFTQVNLLLWSELVYTYQSNFGFKASMREEDPQSKSSMPEEAKGEEEPSGKNELPPSLVTVKEEGFSGSRTSSGCARLPSRKPVARQKSFQQVCTPLPLSLPPIGPS